MDRLAPEVHVAVELFQEVVEELKATVKVSLVLTAGADREELSRRHGLTPSRRPQWANEPRGTPLGVKELAELQVVLLTTLPED